MLVCSFKKSFIVPLEMKVKLTSQVLQVPCNWSHPMSLVTWLTVLLSKPQAQPHCSPDWLPEWNSFLHSYLLLSRNNHIILLKRFPQQCSESWGWINHEGAVNKVGCGQEIITLRVPTTGQPYCQLISLWHFIEPPHKKNPKKNWWKLRGQYI